MKTLLASLTATALAFAASNALAEDDDFSWIRGTNYVPSYASTDVVLWLDYDHKTIDRELGYAESIGLNAVRIFLQSFVYQHDPDAFLRRFEDFVATAHSRGLKTMPVLFDSCFGVSPSLESRHLWVANPGPDRMAERFRPELDEYVEAVVSRYRGDDRIVIWDVMNEPSATPLASTQAGREQLLAFLGHYCPLVKKLDPSHPITVGVARADNAFVLDLVDVLSCHSYLPSVDAFRQSLATTRDQAAAADKPWIVTECGNPAQGCHYEMAMPVVHEFGVGSFPWELMIGRTQFDHQQGLFYPDGTVRRIEQVEAVADRPADFLVEKPDREGKPFRRASPERIAEYLAFVTRNPVSDDTWCERNTLVTALAAFQGAFGDRTQETLRRRDEAREAYAAGKKQEAFQTVGELLITARLRLADPKRQVVPDPLPEKAYVYRDVYGVPHIFADTEPAAAYAFAMVQCDDNANQVFHNLRAAVGRTAEIHGESAVAQDRTVLLWRLPEIMEGAWRGSPPRTKRFLQAFCDGLNAYRREHPDECKHTMPATPVAVMALLKYVGHMPSVGMIDTEINSVLGVSETAAPAPDQSSTFAIGPTRTASGRPILLIDPHWPADGIFSFYEFHLHAGRLQVGGFTVPGLPFAAVGYTTGVAWSGTAGGADSADAFELEVNPANPDQYRYDGRWLDMTVREIALPVKTEGGVERRKLTLRETLHGPVVKEENGRVFAGAVCGWKDTSIVEQWLAMNRARTRDELLDAVALDQATWINFVYATREGHIGYVQTGSCPLRSDRYVSMGVQDGTTSEANWRGRIPFDDLPQLHDPDSGWLHVKKHHGNVLVPWGNVLRLRRGDVDLPLDGDALPDSETMRSTGNTRLTDDGRCVFSGGQVVTSVVELTDPVRVRTIVPYGQSRKPGSRHATDQMRLYSAGTMRPAWHTWDQLRHHVESVEVIEYYPGNPR